MPRPDETFIVRVRERNGDAVVEHPRRARTAANSRCRGSRGRDRALARSKAPPARRRLALHKSGPRRRRSAQWSMRRAGSSASRPERLDQLVVLNYPAEGKGFEPSLDRKTHIGSRPRAETAAMPHHNWSHLPG